jgi:hydrogenase/urease accessory protein HupE
MIKRTAAILCLIMLSGAAYAHLLPKQNATMNIVDKSAFFVVSVPVSALEDVDSDGDGLLSLNELQNNAAPIQSQFARRFHVSDAGNPATPVLSWVAPPQNDGEPLDSDYVVLLHRVNFAKTPANPVIKTDLFGTKAGEAQMTLKASRNNKTESEVAILTTSAPEHIFFRGGFAIFADFVRIGLEHILGGFDHLLFLLTIVIAAAGWRYWLAVVTSFTIAHSITLALSALNILRIPANIIEPGIAASIILMALLNLRSAKVDDARARWGRVAIVFACGLLHGFGFAGAIGAMAVDSGSRIATLAGFNVGIEIGQLLFVGAVLVIIALFKRIGQIKIADQIPRFASIAAAALGALLLVQRLEIF